MTLAVNITGRGFPSFSIAHKAGLAFYERVSLSDDRMRTRGSEKIPADALSCIRPSLMPYEMASVKVVAAFIYTGGRTSAPSARADLVFRESTRWRWAELWEGSAA